MGKIIAIANRRGKVGKSTTAVNLSIAFAKSGKKTLLADLDSAGSCFKAFGFTKRDTPKNIFSGSKPEVTFKKAILKTEINNLHLIYIKSLPYLDEFKAGGLAVNEHILNITLKPLAVKYEYVIMDCPPYHAGTINASLMVADSVVIPVTTRSFSTVAVSSVLSQIDEIKRNYNPDLKVDGILLTNYEFNNEDSFNLKKELFKDYPKLMFNTSIPNSPAVNKASEENKPLLIYKPEDRAAKAYIKAADELFERKSLFNSKGKN
jgi:chromosome partitioning protein